MTEEARINLDDVLMHLRDLIGTQAQENAILKATIKKLEDERNTRDCACSSNN